MIDEPFINIKILIIIFAVLGVGMALGFLIDFYTTPYKIFPTKAPSNFINSEQIHFYNDSICIDITNASYSTYAGTGSMRPTLDENSNGITIKPNSVDDIHIGDMVTYTQLNCDSNKTCTTEELIIHRVIEIGYDEKGWYAITKGDNNNYNDGKIRWLQIRRKTIMLIY